MSTGRQYFYVESQLITKTGRVKRDIRHFASEAARARWVEDRKKDGTLHDVLRFSGPDNFGR
jgi:hypothetical protein